MKKENNAVPVLVAGIVMVAFALLFLVYLTPQYEQIVESYQQVTDTYQKIADRYASLGDNYVSTADAYADVVEGYEAVVAKYLTVVSLTRWTGIVFGAMSIIYFGFLFKYFHSRKRQSHNNPV